MKAEQAYLKYQLKVEKNGTNDNIATDRGRFVLLFNESQNKFIEWILDNKNKDDIRYIEKLLVLDKKVEESKTYKNHQYFQFPKNYFDFSNVYAYASSDCCKEEKIDLFPIKEENKNEILQDEYNKPSFLWREAPYTIASNGVNIYKDVDFKFDYILLSYYRYPNQISLTSQDNPESGFTNTEIEFDDKTVDRILSIAAGEFDLNQENSRFQLQKQRVIQKF